MQLLSLFFLIYPQTTRSECNKESSCESCYSSSFLCHWCKDIPSSEASGSCHYKFSQYGCQVGDACSPDDCSERNTCSSCVMGGCKYCASVKKCVSPYSWTCALPSNCEPNQECMRSEPEFIGYIRGIPDWVIAVLLSVYVLVVTVSAVTMLHAYRYWIVPPSSSSTLADTERDQRSSRNWIFGLVAASWTLVLVALGVLFFAIALYWPSPPEVSMCNAQLMWSDTINMIVNTVTTGKASVESEILITVYNPNRVTVALHSVSGNISYKGELVGSVDLGPIDARPGSAADGLGVVTFNGFERIAEMYYDFNVKHQLILEFELFISFQIASIGSFDVAVPKTRLNVNNPPPQKYCKCLDDASPNPEDALSVLPESQFE